MTSSADNANTLNRMESIEYFIYCITIGDYIPLKEYRKIFPRIDDSESDQQTNPSYRDKLRSYLIPLVTGYCKISPKKISKIFEKICNKEELLVGLYILSLFDSELLLTSFDNKEMQCHHYDLECRNIQLSLVQIWNKAKSDKLYCHLINSGKSIRMKNDDAGKITEKENKNKGYFEKIEEKVKEIKGIPKKKKEDGKKKKEDGKKKKEDEMKKYLLSCNEIKLKKASLRNINLSQMKLDGMVFHECNLENVDFSYSCMKNINLSYSNIQNGNFIRSDLMNGNLLSTNLCGADFTNANLCKAHLTYGQLANANFSYANLEGAEFMMCSVNNDTILKGRPEHFIDKDTNFTGVSLSSARIDPRLSNALEHNVRKKQWEKWYYDKNLILTSPIRFFWYLSDYGTSGKRACACLLLVNSLSWLSHNIFHTNILAKITTLSQINLYEVLRSIVLNITDYQKIYLSPADTACIFQSNIVSLFNYFLLAVLVTRFAIMFQNKSY